MTVADAVAGVLAGETGDLLREAVCPLSDDFHAHDRKDAPHRDVH
ncbi:MAG: hypothetical protein U0R69_04040 [Gaiellales bacterium]